MIFVSGAAQWEKLAPVAPQLVDAGLAAVISGDRLDPDLRAGRARRRRRSPRRPATKRPASRPERWRRSPRRSARRTRSCSSSPAAPPGGRRACGSRSARWCTRSTPARPLWRPTGVRRRPSLPALRAYRRPRPVHPRPGAGTRADHGGAPRRARARPGPRPDLLLLRAAGLRAHARRGRGEDRGALAAPATGGTRGRWPRPRAIASTARGRSATFSARASPTCSSAAPCAPGWVGGCAGSSPVARPPRRRSSVSSRVSASPWSSSTG